MSKNLVFDNEELCAEEANGSVKVDDLNTIKSAMELFDASKKRALEFDSTDLKKSLQQVKSQEDSTDHMARCVTTFIRRPIHSEPLCLMLAGTSGTGKTYTAEIIANSLKSIGYSYLRLSMTEYNSEADSWKFLGSTVGHVGSEDNTPIFKERMKSRKIVICFDEIEKAHKTLFRNIQQLMDKGVLSNGRGEEFDFKDCILIFTTNLAMDDLLIAKQSLTSEEVSVTDHKYQSLVKGILQRSGLPTDISGRINYVFTYNALDACAVALIVVQEIRKLAEIYGMRINRIEKKILSQIAVVFANQNEGARLIKTYVKINFENLFQDFSGDKDKLFDIISLNDNEYEISESRDKKFLSIEEVVEDFGSSNLIQTEEIDRLFSGADIVEVQVPIKPYFQAINAANLSKATGLLVLDKGNTGEATGFVISSNGLVLTCSHCIDLNAEIEFFLGNSISYPVKEILYKNDDIDIAIIKIDGQNLPYLKITDSRIALEMGSQIGLLSYPQGRAMGVEVSYTEGVVSKIEDGMYITNANAAQGSSGAPLFDLNNGKIYGVLKGGYGAEGGNLNVATDIRELFKQPNIKIDFCDDYYYK